MHSTDAKTDNTCIYIWHALNKYYSNMCSLFYCICYTCTFYFPIALQVSAWGGYVFIINLVPLHVFVLLLMGRYSSRVYVGKALNLLSTITIFL